MAIARTHIDTAVAQRATVEINDRSGHAVGMTGIIMGYSDSYDTVKVGFVDESGAYNGEHTRVKRTAVDLLTTPDMTRTVKRTSDTTARTLTFAVSGMADFESDTSENPRWIRANEVTLAYGWNGRRFTLHHVGVQGRYVLGRGGTGTRKFTRTWQVLTVCENGAPRFYVEEGIPQWLDDLAGKYADPDNPRG